MRRARSQTRLKRGRSELPAAPKERNTPIWAWTVVPFAVMFVIVFGPLFLPLEGIVGLAIASFVPFLAVRQPFRALVVLIVALPFHTLAMALLYRIGIPGPMVRQLTYWKELIVVGLVIAAAIRYFRDRHRTDFVDLAGLAYVALGFLFLIAPALFIDGRIATFSDRLAGFRGDVFYVVLFLAARHLRLTGAQIRRLLVYFLGTAMVVAGIAILEFFASDLWNTIATQWFEVQQYKYEVLQVNVYVGPIDDVRVYGTLAGREFVRAGGPEIAYDGTAFYLVTGVAVALERFTRSLGLTALRSFLPLPIIAFGLLVTQTRSAIASAGVLVAIVLMTNRGRAAIARVRTTVLVSAMFVLGVGGAAAIGVLDRFGGDPVSDAAHQRQLTAGWNLFWDHPLGSGLATAAGAGARTGTNFFLVPESQYLQIGIQLGILGLVLFLATWVGAAVMLHRAPSLTDDEDARFGAAALRDAMAGLLLGFYYLVSFVTIGAAWTTWGLAGAALGSVDETRRSRSETPTVAADT